MIIVLQLVETPDNNAGTMGILGGQFLHNGNTIHDGIAGFLYLFNGSNYTVKVGTDAVGHCAVRFIQMFNGHNIADIAEDNTGKL